MPFHQRNEESNNIIKVGDVADLFTRASETFASGLSGGFDQPAVGYEILHPWETVDIVDLIEYYQPEYSADAWNRSQTEIGISIMLFSDKGYLARAFSPVSNA